MTYFVYDNLKVLAMIRFYSGNVNRLGKKAAFFELIGHSTKFLRHWLRLNKVR